MKTNRSSIRARGSVLVITLVMALLVALTVAALLFVAQQQNYMNARSHVWSSEIPLAEAGIEEAMTHLNSLPTSLAANGWSLVGSNYVKTRFLSNDYFYTAISTAAAPTVVSIGYGRIPLQTNYTHRTVMVTTKTRSSGYGGVIAKTTVLMSGGAWVNSFDSSDPLHSTSGLYDATKPKDGAIVASVSGLNPAIDSGTGKIYGNVATGLGGTAIGNVGDGTFLASNSGVQSGHSRNDFIMNIPDVTVPFGGGLPLPSPVGNIYTLTSGDYRQGTSLNIGGGKGIIISGKVRIYFTTDFTTSGSGFIKVMPGASVEFYFGGTTTISGSAIVNQTHNAASCGMYCLPSCTRIDYTGSSAYIGTLYAPQATATLSGSAGASGSFLAKNFVLTGGMNIHYDESLGGSGPKYQIASWEEL